MESVFPLDSSVTSYHGDINNIYESYTVGWAKIIGTDSGDFTSTGQYFGIVFTSDSSLSCID